ncbi:metallophosphoesterase [Paenibacillus sp. 2RAB27]|uniref:metallophosphoesterase family protein n=1 Tax=Paenibacillus sp. 2RAB27 TaxID=3232991 RepID=UPI003F969E56
MLIKWAQLSDIHHLYNNYETTVMRDNLIEYLHNIQDEIDWLFITGDIAHRGGSYGPETISFLDSLLESIDIGKQHLFIVPGNHDLNRNPMVDRLASHILSAPNAKDEVNSIDSGTFETILSIQEPFFRFYKEYMDEEYPKNALHFVKRCPGFNVLHINTCLIAGSKGVEGKILIGLSKLYEATKHLPKDNTINIAIGHHTINCIHNDERESLLNRFSDSRIDLYMNGHVHKAAYHNESDNYNNTQMFNIRFSCCRSIF